MMFSQLRTTRPLRHVSVPSPPSMWSSALTPTPPSSRSLPAPPSSVSRPQYAWLSSQSFARQAVDGVAPRHAAEVIEAAVGVVGAGEGVVPGAAVHPLDVAA